MAYTVNIPVGVDGDGLPDSWEQYFFGGLAHNGTGDADVDGVSDFAEYMADTNPTNAASALRITSLQLASEGNYIEWQGGTSAKQELQRGTRVDDSNAWTNIFTVLPPTPTSGSYTDVVTTNVMQLYRIRVTR